MRTKRRRGAAAVRTLFCAMLLLVAGAAVAAAQEFPAFLPMPGVNPEGVAVDKAGNVYVSVREGTHGAIWKFTPDGGQSRFADVGTGMIGGLAISANGTVYVAMAAGSDQGVYRLDRDGEAELLPGTGQIVFANALAFDSRGTLYVTESYSNRAPDYGPGGVWRIQPGEEAGLWIRPPR